MYDNYVQCLADYSSDHRPVSKISFSKIMQRVFKTLQLSQTHGIRMYRGIKINIPDKRNCKMDDIKAIADVYGFFDMKANDKLKFGIGSGYCVNKNEVLKIIEIYDDKKWKFIVAGHEVEPDVIGMPQSVTCETYLNAKIIFNTVKQAQICIGREEEKNKRSSRFRIVQEWNVSDENIVKVRSTSRKCQRVLLFSAISEACPNCYNTKDYVPSKHKDTRSDDEMFNKLFPGACDTMRKHLQDQSKCCRNNKDPCCHSRDQETIRIAMPLWNRSPQVLITGHKNSTRRS